MKLTDLYQIGNAKIYRILRLKRSFPGTTKAFKSHTLFEDTLLYFILVLVYENDEKHE